MRKELCLKIRAESVDRDCGPGQKDFVRKGRIKYDGETSDGFLSSLAYFMYLFIYLFIYLFSFCGPKSLSY